MEGKGSEAEFKVIESVVIIPKALTAIQFRHNPRSQWKEYAPLLRDYASVALCLASFAADACSLYDAFTLSADYLKNTKQVSTRTLVCDFQSAMVTNPGAMWIFCNDHCCVAFIDAMGRISSKQVHCCQLAGRLNDAFHWCPPGANLKPRPPLSKSIFLAKGFSRLSEVASDLPPGPTPPS